MSLTNSGAPVPGIKLVHRKADPIRFDDDEAANPVPGDAGGARG